MSKSGNTTFYNRISGILFVFLLIYFVLRAWLVEPIHDEAATFLHFIEPGHIWDDKTLLDANNHLLNSYLGRMMYNLFGLHFFLFRLPSLLAFILYFVYTRKLSREIDAGWWGFLVFLSLNTVPWITDYFSYTRGYGMALAFFMAALYFLRQFTRKQSWKNSTLICLFLLLCVASNLTYLISSLLIVGIMGIVWLTAFRKIPATIKVAQVLTIALFMSGLYIFIRFSFDLKDAGALYYGSLDGLWWVTGKTLSRYVLFYDGDWLRYAYLTGGIVVAATGFYRLRKYNWKSWFTLPFVQWGFILAMNLTAILFLAKVLKVNYPEDRAAMYMVPLSILIVGAIFAKTRYGRYALLLLLFFPLSFIWRLNLNTSVFSPDDRMSDAFHAAVRKELKANEPVAIYPIMQLTWSLQERKYGKQAHPGVPLRGFNPYYNIILTKTSILKSPKEYPGYEVFAADPAAEYIALRRKRFLSKKPLRTFRAQAYSGQNEFVDLYNDTIPEAWKNRMIRIEIEADVSIEKHVNTLNLTWTTEDANGTLQRYLYQNIRWYVGENKQHFHLQFPVAENNFGELDKKLKIYLWNQDKLPIKLKNSCVKISLLSED